MFDCSLFKLISYLFNAVNENIILNNTNQKSYVEIQ